MLCPDLQATQEIGLELYPDMIQPFTHLQLQLFSDAGPEFEGLQILHPRDCKRTSLLTGPAGEQMGGRIQVEWNGWRSLPPHHL